MPVVATQRKYLSDLLVACSSYEDDSFTNFNFASVTVGGTATDVEPIGIPVIWVNANSRFEIYVAQSIATAISTGGSPLKDGSVIAVLVGGQRGVGENREDVDLSAGDTTLTALYRGDATLLKEGMDWGAADANAQAAFLAQLEAQRITTADNAEVVTPSYTA